MAENNNPSVDPADTKGLSGLLRFAMKKQLQKTDGMLPAKVIAVTADRSFATVQPMIMVQGTDGALTMRPQYARIPVGAMGAGNYVLSFPITPGDLGWISASDRDISLFIQSMDAAGPNTNRLHAFEDGVFWPDKARQWALADGDAAKAVFQSLDGSIKITLGTDQITIEHPTAIVMEAPNISLLASAKLILHAGTEFNWDVDGYGFTYVAGGAGAYIINSYTVGATITNNALAIDPPGPLP